MSRATHNAGSFLQNLRAHDKRFPDARVCHFALCGNIQHFHMCSGREQITPFPSSSSGIKTLPPKMDEEADRLALYLLALAGYDPGAAVTTLQGLAAVNPQSVANGYTALHPLSPQRVALMTQTVAEIRQKQIAKKAVVP